MITISSALLQTIIQYMNSKRPNEGCGYLAGVDHEIVQFIPMTNILNSPHEFAFEPSDQFDAMRNARSMGYSLIGVVHSHPDGSATPSSKDIAYADPYLLQLIIAPENDSVEIKCFHIENGVVHSIEIEYL